MKNVIINNTVPTAYVSLNKYSEMTGIPANTCRVMILDGRIILRPKKARQKGTFIPRANHIPKSQPELIEDSKMTNISAVNFFGISSKDKLLRAHIFSLTMNITPQKP